MNDQLFQLYSSKWPALRSAFNTIYDDERLGNKPTNPLLIFIDKEEEYRKADIRILICGQETNGWFENGNGDIGSVMNCYNEFFCGGKCWSYGGQFWNGFSRFRTLFENRYPGKKIRYVWNNIVKIGKAEDKGMPPSYIYEIERNYFSVFKEELEILKPDLVLFLTGPHYDKILTDTFGELRFECLPTFSERALSKLNLPGSELAFRTYHPNYLWRHNINRFFKAIIDQTIF